MELLLKDGRLTDFTIKLSDSNKEISAHKAVLSARSPVFAAMLEPHTEEHKTSSVVIDDVEYEVQ